MFCAECGYDILLEGAAYCPNCGATLARGPETFEIASYQRVGTIEGGGKAVTTEIHHVAGDVIFPSRDAQAPSREAVAAYLEVVVEQQAGATQPQKEYLRQLWEVPFHARAPAEIAGERLNLVDAVRKIFRNAKRTQRIQRVVILADAGQGKTPCLQYLMTETAKRSLATYRSYLTRREKLETATLQTFIIPLVISLADLRAGLTLPALVRAAYNRFAPSDIALDEVDLFLEEKAYDCLLLLDGLDAAASSHQGGGIQAVRHFMDTHRGNQYAISCRTASYHGQLGGADVLILDDLSDAEVQQVLGEARYAELSEPLRRLSRTRATLEMILELRVVPDLPQSKGQLVRRMARGRLGLKPARQTELAHDAELGAETELEATTSEATRIDPEMAEGLLEHLAYAMQRDRVYAYPERRLMELINGYLKEWYEPYTWRQVARYLRSSSGVLERDEHRRWMFCDRSTQAYFAAAAVIQEPPRIKPILDEASDYWWREVLEIYIGLIDDPAELFFDLIDRDALVAAHCLQLAGRPVERPVADALVDALIERMSRERSVGRSRVVTLLGQSGHPQAKQELLNVLRVEWRSPVILATARALWTMALKSDAQPLDELEARLQEGGDPLRQAEAVIDLWRAHTAGADGAAIEARLAALVDDRAYDRLVSGLAAIAMGAIGTEGAQAALLKRFVDRSYQGFRAWCVTEALTQIPTSEVEQAAIALFKGDAYQDDEWVEHRARAVYLLGRVGSQRTAVTVLYNALTDRHPMIKGRAAQAVGRLEPADARQKLEALLDPAGDAFVLRKTAEALGQVGTVESIPILQRYLRHREAETRWMVRDAIDEIRRRYEL